MQSDCGSQTKDCHLAISLEHAFLIAYVYNLERSYRHQYWIIHWPGMYGAYVMCTFKLMTSIIQSTDISHMVMCQINENTVFWNITCNSVLNKICTYFMKCRGIMSSWLSLILILWSFASLPHLGDLVEQMKLLL